MTLTLENVDQRSDMIYDLMVGLEERIFESGMHLAPHFLGLLNRELTPLQRNDRESYPLIKVSEVAHTVSNMGRDIDKTKLANTERLDKLTSELRDVQKIQNDHHNILTTNRPYIQRITSMAQSMKEMIGDIENLRNMTKVSSSNVTESTAMKRLSDDLKWYQESITKRIDTLSTNVRQENDALTVLHEEFEQYKADIHYKHQRIDENYKTLFHMLDQKVDSDYLTSRFAEVSEIINRRIAEDDSQFKTHIATEFGQIHTELDVMTNGNARSTTNILQELQHRPTHDEVDQMLNGKISQILPEQIATPTQSVYQEFHAYILDMNQKYQAVSETISAILAEKPNSQDVISMFAAGTQDILRQLTENDMEIKTQIGTDLRKLHEEIAIATESNAKFSSNILQQMQYRPTHNEVEQLINAKISLILHN
jgi:hypothetical protein